MDVDRIRKVADMIEAHPEHFDMTWFLKRFGRMVERASAEPLLVAQADLLSCGTTACIGGWAVGLWPAEVQPDDDLDTAGMRILGLSHTEMRGLFYDAVNTIDNATEGVAHLRGMADDYEAASA